MDVISLPLEMQSSFVIFFILLAERSRVICQGMAGMVERVLRFDETLSMTMKEAQCPTIAS